MNCLKQLPGRAAWVRGIDKQAKRVYFLAYTLCFLATCLIVFSWFLLAGKTLIWETDGWKQHYTALVYYGRYLRDGIASLLSGHGLVFPQWGFYFGEGNSVLGTLHYYGIGDPLAALSVFVPEPQMYLFYNAMSILRLYLAGIAFSFLCFQTGVKGRCAVLAGAMTYVFCYWALLCAARHPFFLNPMIYFPLLILGVEKIIGKGRPYLLSAAVCLSALSNFYFFYILVALTVIYVAARLITKYRTDIASIARTVLRIAASSILGVVMSAVILLPILYVFLKDTRMTADSYWPLFYPGFYYAELPQLFVQGGAIRWMCMGYSVPVFLAGCMLVPKRKQHGFLLLLFTLTAVVIAFPAFGKILSAFSYVGNRWSFAFALLAAYILAALWPSLMGLSWKGWLYLAACTASYLLLCLALGAFWEGEFPYLAALLFILLLLLRPAAKGKKPFLAARWKQAAAFSCVIISIAVNAYGKYNLRMYLDECLPKTQVSNGYPNTPTKAVKKAIKADGYDGFSRYSGRSLIINAGAVAGLPSTDYYWSISNPSVAEYRSWLDMLEYNQYNYKGYDDRAALLSLANVRYYVMPLKDKAPPPYGFSYMDTYRVKGISKYKAYCNDYALPLAYTYDSYVTSEGCNGMTSVEKQQAMLQSVILEEPADGFQEASLHMDSTEIPYTISGSSGDVTIKDHAFVVGYPGSSVTLSFHGIKNSETYLSIAGLDFDDPQRYTEQATMELEASNGMKKKLYYFNSTSPRTYNGRHDFTACMGYSQEPEHTVTIKFLDAGTYSFDNIRLYCQPMDDYARQLNALKEDTLEHETVRTDKVSGKISLDQPKILCLSIPFDEGWHAYVDGAPAKLYRANIKNMALALKAGEHTIELRYEMPMQKAGAAVSACGFLIFAAAIIWDKKRARREEVQV